MISKKNILYGGLLGLLCSTVTLIWVLVIYDHGDSIYLEGERITQGVSVGFCVIWYIFDVGSLLYWIAEKKESSHIAVGNTTVGSNSQRKQLSFVFLAIMLVGAGICGVALTKYVSIDVGDAMAIVGTSLFIISCLGLIISLFAPIKT
jgi:hypothetical protein